MNQKNKELELTSSLLYTTSHTFSSIVINFMISIKQTKNGFNTQNESTPLNFNPAAQPS
ncbi:MAG: hypothetical protein K0Q87_2844 [Neobacillus sp.]|jgi:hypothetical protein|nr:hypothetical protein [Neobacillus sp.]